MVDVVDDLEMQRDCGGLEICTDIIDLVATENRCEKHPTARPRVDCLAPSIGSGGPKEKACGYEDPPTSATIASHYACTCSLACCQTKRALTFLSEAWDLAWLMPTLISPSAARGEKWVNCSQK
jgi:hypothetical protein